MWLKHDIGLATLGLHHPCSQCQEMNGSEQAYFHEVTKFSVGFANCILDSPNTETTDLKA